MKKDSTLYITGFISLISIVLGFGVAIVHYSTAPLLERNEVLHRNRTLVKAFGIPVTGNGAEAYARAVQNTIKVDSIRAESRTFEIFTDLRDNSIGFIFSGVGFWDVIRGIVVLAPDLSRIKNIRFLAQQETPGLGARIEEESFTDSFKDLPLAWDDPENHCIVIGDCTLEQAENCVNAVTGATQTSMALMKSLNEELKAFREVVGPDNALAHAGPASNLLLPHLDPGYKK